MLPPCSSSRRLVAWIGLSQENIAARFCSSPNSCENKMITSGKCWTRREREVKVLDWNVTLVTFPGLVGMMRYGMTATDRLHLRTCGQLAGIQAPAAMTTPTSTTARHQRCYIMPQLSYTLPVCMWLIGSPCLTICDDLSSDYWATGKIC